MLKERIDYVRQRIDLALRRSKRSHVVEIVAVTKKVGVPQIREAIQLGITNVAESRVKEAVEKFGALADLSFKKHMVGHLQSNKVKLCVENFDCIQSLDSLKLAKEINLRAMNAGKIMEVMIQVNTAGDDRQGILPSQVEHFYGKLISFRNIKVIGLMTIAPYVSPEETRPSFRMLREINERLGLKYLSMGMTNDYEVAVEEGSNMIRIGTALFH
ncbi:MAG: YggS family pyridoxal phosphate-dependent enzyme [Candidatus Woesearchaeota archaeon]